MTLILSSEKRKNLTSFFVEQEKETEEEEKRRKENSNITKTDRLRFIEAVLSDEVKELYKKSQDCLNRAQLDGRNSIVKMVDFL